MEALIPPPRDDDDEDVYLALQTAKALWSRNERDDALRWLRRAAEQASDANADDRALELFKAAAEVAAKMQASVAPPPAATPSTPPGRPPGPPPPPNRKPVELAPGPRPSAAPPGRPVSAGGSVPPQPAPGRFPSVPPQAAPAAAPPPYTAGGSQTPPPPPVRPAAAPSRPPQPSAHTPPGAVPLIRAKSAPGQVTPQQAPPPAARPQGFTPAPPQARPAQLQSQPPHPSQPQLQQPPAPRMASSPPMEQQAHRGTSAGIGPPGALLFDEADPDDDPADAVPTQVGRLPPEIRQMEEPAPAPPPQRQLPPMNARPAPVAQAPAATPRKAARRRTMSRGEQSPLASGRRSSTNEHRQTGEHNKQPAQQPAQQPAPDARRGRAAPLQSEVPTAPGNEGKAGASSAARAAALRALALQDDEVTAQRDVSLLKKLRDMPIDDLDEDTSVLPGLKAAMQARRAEEAAAKAAAAAKPAAARPQYTPPPDDDRPTPTDMDGTSVGPDTSRTSTAAIEAGILETGRYVPNDGWGTTTGRARSPTIENPAAVFEAAAADAAVAAAQHPARAAVPVAGAAAPMSAFRVAVYGPDATGALRIAALAPGANPPAGATAALIVPTSAAESAALNHLFGVRG